MTAGDGSWEGLGKDSDSNHPIGQIQVFPEGRWGRQQRASNYTFHCQRGVGSKTVLCFLADPDADSEAPVVFHHIACCRQVLFSNAVSCDRFPQQTNKGVVNVEFYVDGVPHGYKTLFSPYSFSWDAHFRFDRQSSVDGQGRMMLPGIRRHRK